MGIKEVNTCTRLPDRKKKNLSLKRLGQVERKKGFTLLKQSAIRRD